MTHNRCSHFLRDLFRKISCRFSIKRKQKNPTNCATASSKRLPKRLSKRPFCVLSKITLGPIAASFGALDALLPHTHSGSEGAEGCECWGMLANVGKRTVNSKRENSKRKNSKREFQKSTHTPVRLVCVIYLTSTRYAQAPSLYRQTQSIALFRSFSRFVLKII